MPPSRGFAPPIEDYALIGDCRTAALVSRAGSIDWLCLPRFDSPACLAALLDTKRAGFWRIAPAARARIARAYRPGTLILETCFHTASGSAVLIDFMPPRTDPEAASGPAVLRIVRGLTGSVAMRMHLALRFDYGALIPWVTRTESGHGIAAVAGPDLVVLHASVPLENRAFVTHADFTLHAGEEASFALAHGPSHLAAPVPPGPARALRATETFWTGWSGRNRVQGEFRPLIERSLITLKALTSAETGGIVAAPTTSLPEQAGGGRNWDYRYCWLRDASLTLLALLEAGYREEAEAWSAWLRRAVAGDPGQMRALYGLGGERRLTEWEVPWLAGYRGARPVRIGNAASDQLQIDIYGEVIDALCGAKAAGLAAPGETWGLLREITNHLGRIWRLPDESIWEVRGGRRHFVFSKVMAWVAMDRAAGEAERRGASEAGAWRRTARRIHAEVCARGFDSARGSFMQAYGSTTLDASVLMMPLFGFLPATDPRMLSTVAAIERDLLRDGLVRRYRTEDGIDGVDGDEGVFLACSFWLADILALQGRTAEARALFLRLAGLANDVGLLAEEYDPARRRLMGNFPQAFSHLALIRTAFGLGEWPRRRRRGRRGRHSEPETANRRDETVVSD
ncbi:MAG: glycoside hydrolase family 15 protein [Rhodospirillales bacterium]|nr:glycoside hydrolase family 15 protein [Rhodospirillales bacterium]